MKPGALGGAPAAFAGDDLEFPVRARAADDRLHHALGLDRFAQGIQRGLVEIPTRLMLARRQRIQRQFTQVVAFRVFARVAGSRCAQQRVQSAPQSSFLNGHVSLFGCWVEARQAKRN